jgi:hypothetical protein
LFTDGLRFEVKFVESPFVAITTARLEAPEQESTRAADAQALLALPSRDGCESLPKVWKCHDAELANQALSAASQRIGRNRESNEATERRLVG